MSKPLHSYFNTQREDTQRLNADQQSAVQQTAEVLSITSTKDAFSSMYVLLISATKDFRVIIGSDGFR